MKAKLSHWGAAFCVLGTALLPATTDAATVVPSGYEFTEAAGFSGVLAVPLRLQEVYGAGMFGGSPMLVTSVAFRLDASQGPVSSNISTITMSMSTTSKSPDGLSVSYADNLGPDNAVVYSGLLSVNASGGGSPSPFEIVVDLANPFSYDPSSGNLLVDITTYSNTGLWWVDASNSPSDNASRVFGYSVGSATATFADTGADVLLLGTQSRFIPEPPASCLAMAGLGIGLVAFRTLRRQTRQS